MAIYLLLYLLIVLYTLLCQRITIRRPYQVEESEKIKNKHTAISAGIFLMVFLLLALRAQSMGIDLGYDNSTGYLANFELIAGTSWAEILSGVSFQHYEPGYIYLNKLIGSFTTDRQIFLIVISAISLFPFHMLVKNSSDNAPMSWIIFLGLPIFLLMYSGLRQTIAIAICVLAFQYIKKRKWFPFFLLVAAAFLFHRWSLVFALAYPAYRAPIQKKTRVITLVGLLVVYMFRTQLLGLASSLFGVSVIIDNNGAFIFFAFLVLIYIFCMVFSDGEEETEGLMNIYFLACICQCFSAINSIAARTAFYFMPVLLVLLPRIVVFISNDHSRMIAKTVVYLGFVLYGLFSIQTTDWAQAVPYLFFWQN